MYLPALAGGDFAGVFEASSVESKIMDFSEYWEQRELKEFKVRNKIKLNPKINYCFNIHLPALSTAFAKWFRSSVTGAGASSDVFGSGSQISTFKKTIWTSSFLINKNISLTVHSLYIPRGLYSRW